MSDHDAEVVAMRQTIADVFEYYVIGIHGSTSAQISEREAMVLAVLALRALTAAGYAIEPPKKRTDDE